MEKSDAGKVALNCLVFEVLLPKKGHKLAQGMLISGIGLDAMEGAEGSVATVAGGI
jgi:hypothetical protein